MRRPLLVLLLALLGLAVAPYPSPPAVASCAAPYLDLPAEPTLTRGADSTVEGRAFVDGCRDTMSCSGLPGCESCESDGPPERPLRDVRLELVQGDRTWPLGTADAGTAADDRLGQVTWTFTLPADVRPGPAVLQVDGEEQAEVVVG
ncbi:hypothetical protein SAMN05421872_111170 [Nocardioides lianchengensis]|uniref:Uncharacterized protein n=2 Tax=Nocardioides lianchengensis TaxID=1045774 RepID=A0A1G6Y1Q7_9ACTN|nr:hypothetical protein SAMN05421872_111170 [Nocardioides lianchengensis]